MDVMLVPSSKLIVKARLQPDHQEWSEFFPLLSETCGDSHYATYVALACMSAGPPPCKPFLRKGLHFSLCVDANTYLCWCWQLAEAGAEGEA